MSYGDGSNSGRVDVEVGESDEEDKGVSSKMLLFAVLRRNSLVGSVVGVTVVGCWIEHLRMYPGRMIMEHTPHSTVPFILRGSHFYLVDI
jgi:hypothetical protein